MLLDSRKDAFIKGKSVGVRSSGNFSCTRMTSSDAQANL